MTEELAAYYNSVCTKRNLTPWDIKCMAYHEAGHAICSFFSPEQGKLILITIDPTNEAFGMIRTKVRAHHNETDISLRGKITTLLAGRLSEQMFLGITTTSCIHDLATASAIARDMVMKFGMGTNFPLYSAKSPCNDEYVTMSDSLFREMEDEAVAIIDQCNQKAQDILASHQSILQSIVTTLIDRKTIQTAAINKLFGIKRCKVYAKEK